MGSDSITFCSITIPCAPVNAISSQMCLVSIIPISMVSVMGYGTSVEYLSRFSHLSVLNLPPPCTCQILSPVIVVPDDAAAVIIASSTFAIPTIFTTQVAAIITTVTVTVASGNCC